MKATLFQVPLSSRWTWRHSARSSDSHQDNKVPKMSTLGVLAFRGHDTEDKVTMRGRNTNDDKTNDDQTNTSFMGWAEDSHGWSQMASHVQTSTCHSNNRRVKRPLIERKRKFYSKYSENVTLLSVPSVSVNRFVTFVQWHGSVVDPPLSSSVRFERNEIKCLGRWDLWIASSCNTSEKSPSCVQNLNTMNISMIATQKGQNFTLNVFYFLNLWRDPQIPGELTPSQRQRLPQNLEDCQKRVVVLQSQVENLQLQLRQALHTAASFSSQPATNSNVSWSLVSLLFRSSLHTYISQNTYIRVYIYIYIYDD